MDYFGIVKRAYQITTKNRYLWLVGLLAGGLGAGQSFNFSMPSSSMQEAVSTGTMPAYLSDIWTRYWSLFVVVFGVIAVFGIIYFIISIIANGGLLGSVKMIEQGKKTSFWISFAFGWHKFWKVFGASLLFGFIIVLSLAIFLAPTIIFAVGEMYILAILYGLITFLIFIALWIYLAIAYPYILRMAVLSDKGVLYSFEHIWPFFKKHWKEIIVMYLILMALSIAIGFALIIGIIFVGALLVGIGIALYFASSTLGIIYSVFAAIALFVTLLVVGGVVNSFTSSILTLTYLKLEKNI